MSMKQAKGEGEVSYFILFLVLWTEPYLRKGETRVIFFLFFFFCFRLYFSSSCTVKRGVGE